MIDPAKIAVVLWGLHRHGRPGIASDILASLQRACAEHRIGPHVWAAVNAKDVAYILGRPINGQRVARTIGYVYEAGKQVRRPLFAPFGHFERDQLPPPSVLVLARITSKRNKITAHQLVLARLAEIPPDCRGVLSDVMRMLNDRRAPRGAS